jgi:hypothetical protein
MIWVTTHREIDMPQTMRRLTRLRIQNFQNHRDTDIVLALGSPPHDKEIGGLSYAEQLASYFLVSLSSDSLPLALSKLTGISDMEQAAQIQASDNRKTRLQAVDTIGA